MEGGTVTRFEIGEDIAVVRDGVAVDLPKSRKARALLAFLLFQPRPAGRERLCEMFWDRAADPRGGLRWALTRIKRVLGPDAAWLDAGRNMIELKVPPDRISVQPGLGEALLAGTASGAHDSYAAWLASFREAESAKPQELENASAVRLRQTIRYTQAPDGTRIAYAEMGDGPPLMKAANWLSHLDAELEVPLWSGLCYGLAKHHCLYRYDERGNGLSDWRVADLSFDAFVADLECVVDAIGVERFPLIGISQGGAVSIEFAARHPERVSALILIGAYAAGWRLHPDPAFVSRREAEMTLVQHGWGDNSPAYRQIFSHTFLPQASVEDIDAFNEFQRQTTSAENAARFIDTFGDIDVRHRLAEVETPALVLHSRDDQRVAAGVGAQLAASLPNARLETLPSANHVPLATEPAFEKMMDAIHGFLAEHQNH
jgi:pimeloyl-ACP methyl ester carboxylesterase